MQCLLWMMNCTPMFVSSSVWCWLRLASGWEECERTKSKIFNYLLYCFLRRYFTWSILRFPFLLDLPICMSPLSVSFSAGGGTPIRCTLFFAKVASWSFKPSLRASNWVTFTVSRLCTWYVDHQERGDLQMYGRSIKLNGKLPRVDDTICLA